MNREEWLNTMVKKLNPIFEEAGYQVPKNIRCSVGFPSKGVKSKVIGECWDLENSADSQYEIFVHPNQDDAVKVSGILVHEICHTVVGVKEKHNGQFKDCALKVGLCGKMKATTESPELVAKLDKLIKEIGPYPHSKLVPVEKEIGPKNTNVVKVVCSDCGYIVRTSKKWVARGLPTCCCGKEMVEETVEVGE